MGYNGELCDVLCFCNPVKLIQTGNVHNDIVEWFNPVIILEHCKWLACMWTEYLQGNLRMFSKYLTDFKYLQLWIKFTINKTSNTY